MANVVNQDLSYDASDACVSVLGNGQLIESDDQTPYSADGTHFGSVVLGGDSQVQQFEVKNVCHTDFQFIIGAVVVLGPDGNDFSVTIPVPSVILQGESGFFEVTFSPVSEGYKQAQIEEYFNDGLPASQQFAVDEGVIDAPEIEKQGLGQTILNGTT